jgi:hypothetical protein
LLMEAAQMRDEDADREATAKTKEPGPVELAAVFPSLELTEEERRAPSPASRLVAVSIEGRVLSGEPGTDAALPARLVGLLNDTGWFKTDTGLGELEFFEATTPVGQTVVHFQPESVVFVQSAREARP